MPNASPCPGPARLSRRDLLQAGTAGLLGLHLPGLLRADAARAPGAGPAADACILIFLNGGPSHLDMWDMKPDAPAEIRGPFRPIATSLPGVHLSEHLPRLARQLHHCALVRSVHHSVNNAHAAAVYCALTGHDRGEMGGGAKPSDNPAIGSVLARLRPPRQSVLPYVSMPYITAEGAGGPPQPGFFGGLLGRAFDPLFMLRDPNAPDFTLPELSPAPHLVARRDVFDRLDRLRTWSDRPYQDLNGFQARAFDLLTSPASQRAFHLDREPAAVRDAYGRNIYGQCVLLARRLIEAGTRLACISWAPDANATWDTHANNFTTLEKTLLPQLDRAVASLLDDLAERGLLERTLVVVMGEFGRSPKVNAARGRDHYNACYTLLLAGGGIKAGYVHGASDRIGALPSDRPVTPGDVVSTLYRCLGIDAGMELRDRLARPFAPVPAGGVIPELLA